MKKNVSHMAKSHLKKNLFYFSPSNNEGEKTKTRTKMGKKGKRIDFEAQSYINHKNINFKMH